MAGSSIPDITGAIGNFGNNLGKLFQAPEVPKLQQPNALSSTPTPGQASSTALQRQLTAEQRAYTTSSVLTGGRGLLDDPATTSTVLMGA